MAPPKASSASPLAENGVSPPPAAKKQKTNTAQSSLTSFFQVKQSSKEEEEEQKKAPPAAAAAAQQDDTTPTTTTTNNSLDPIVPRSVSFARNASWTVYRNACIVRKQQQVKNNCEEHRTKLAAFDLDGTLLVWRTNGWPSQLEQYELWNSNVVTKLRDLYDHQDYQLAIVTNQGAIRSAHTGKKATHVKSLLEWLIHTIDRPISVVMSTNKKLGYHKPSASMWNVLEETCHKGREWDIASSLFVGDSVDDPDDLQGGVDVGFARNVGKAKGGVELKFYTPHKYFGPSHAELRKNQQRLDYDEPCSNVLQTRAAWTSGYLSGPILLILVGAQGSGKSTFCQALVQNNEQNWVHLSQDTINNGRPGKREAVEKAVKQALTSNNKKQSVVIDRMHLDETQRAHFIQLAKDAKVPAHAVVLSPPKEIVAERVRERDNHEGGVQGDSGAKLAKTSSDKLQTPKYAEGLALISASSTNEGAAKIVGFYRKVSSSMNGDTADTTIMPTSFPLSNDVALPSIALGTMGLGRKEAQAVVSRAIALGFGAVDTAPTYKNEDKVGEGELDPTSIVIVKVPKGATYAAQVRQELTESLSKLKRKHADLLLLHWPTDVIASDSLKEVWGEMETCHTQGLVRALGVCNFNVQALLLLLSQCSIRPVVNQVERHPLLPQWGLVDLCAQHDILLQAHSPLGQGSNELLGHSVVQQVASRNNRSAAQVVLQWNLQQGVAVVPKCRSEEHMRDVLSARTGRGLSTADMEALNMITETKRFVAPPFMYGKDSYCWGERVPK